jgi:hypothetical protein
VPTCAEYALLRSLLPHPRLGAPRPPACPQALPAVAAMLGGARTRRCSPATSEARSSFCRSVGGPTPRAHPRPPRTAKATATRPARAHGRGREGREGRGGGRDGGKGEGAGARNNQADLASVLRARASCALQAGRMQLLRLSVLPVALQVVRDGETMPAVLRALNPRATTQSAQRAAARPRGSRRRVAREYAPRLNHGGRAARPPALRCAAHSCRVGASVGADYCQLGGGRAARAADSAPAGARSGAPLGPRGLGVHRIGAAPRGRGRGAARTPTRGAGTAARAAYGARG